MSYVTIGMIALTAIAIIFGTLWGMGRGRNRSLLRLILIIGCVVGAIFLRQTITDIIMKIDTGEGTVAEMLASSLNQGEEAMPASLQIMVYGLIEIIFGLLSYFLVFFALRFITWILIYPICKIFIKKGAKKRKGAGALIGLIQGVVVAFAVLVPLNGLAVQVGKLSQVQMDGKPMIEVPAEVGLTEYAESVPNTIYDTVGGWYFDMLTTAETKEGDKITLSGTCDVLTAMVDVGNSFNKFGASLEKLNEGTATNQEKFDALVDASKALRETATKIDNLDKDAKVLLNKIMTEMFAEESTKAFTIEYINFSSIADCFEGLTNYFDKTRINIVADKGDSIEKLVSGFAGSEYLVDNYIGDGTGSVGLLFQAELVDYPTFATEIDKVTNLTALQQAGLYRVFGISI